jgi:hypothetical protein
VVHTYNPLSQEIPSLKSAWATQQDPVSEEGKKKEKEKRDKQQTVKTYLQIIKLINSVLRIKITFKVLKSQ